MADTRKKKSGTAVIAVAVIIVAVILMAVYAVYMFGSKDNNEISAEPPSFPGEETSHSGEASTPTAVNSVKMSEAEVGNLVRFGEYVQDSGITKTPIEWIVLDKQGGKLLLLSYRVLEFNEYNTARDADIKDFKESSLYSYLNGDFANDAFSPDELARIEGDEGDKLFILTSAEAEKYLYPDSHRTAKATRTLAALSERDENENVMWWLADITGDGMAAYVYTDGSIREKGFALDYNRVGVRTAIWVDENAESR